MTSGDWPIPKFFFLVSINGKDYPFQEVSGLDVETQTIEYRSGNSKQFSTIKMPGIAKTGNVIIKRGVFAKDNNFWQWYSAMKTNTVERSTIGITLLDESGNRRMTWTLNNAFPTKISGVNLKSDGNEIAIDSIELAFEGIALE